MNATPATSLITPLAHDEAVMLLAFYVTNALQGGERIALDQHLAECSICRDELDGERQISTAFRELEPVPLVAEASYQRLLAQMAEASKPPVAALSPPIPFPQRRAKPAWTTGWRPAALAASLGALIIGGQLVISRASLSPSADYHTLAQDESGAPRDISDFQVVFKGPVTANARAEVLAKLNLAIINGPSAGGVYAVRINPRVAHEPATTLQALRARPEIALAYSTSQQGAQK